MGFINQQTSLGGTILYGFPALPNISPAISPPPGASGVAPHWSSAAAPAAARLAAAAHFRAAHGDAAGPAIGRPDVPYKL